MLTNLSTTEVAYREYAYASASRVAVLDAISKRDPISATKSAMGSSYCDLIDTLCRVARDRFELRAAGSCFERLAGTRGGLRAARSLASSRRPNW